MRTIITGVFTLIAWNLNAQQMENVQHIVTQLFVASDERNWSLVEESFAEEVLLDYSSMNGNPATKLTPTQITEAWKGILPGFEYTHHQLGNFQISVTNDSAHVFCYGTATHYLTSEEGNLWTVVGSYDITLIKDSSNTWRITGMKLNFKYQDGNLSLPEKAIQNVKKQPIKQ